MQTPRGFTLSELLIALAILGVIATFTIPKVLQSQQDTKYKAIAKETIGALSEAYQSHKLKGQLSPSTLAIDLTTYLNTVKVDTVSTIDHAQGWGDIPCSLSWNCHQLHNGAILAAPGTSFGGSASTNVLFYILDPDAKASSYESVAIFVYYDGHIRTFANINPGTRDSNFNHTADPTYDPPWFNWD